MMEITLKIKKNILYEEDNDISDEYEILKKIWKEVGVTDVYIENFETVINNLNNKKEEILQNLRNEEKQMIKFKEELLKVVSEIEKREKDINNIKKLNSKYLNIKTHINISPKRNIKNMKQKEEIKIINKEKQKKKFKNQTRSNTILIIE